MRYFANGGPSAHKIREACTRALKISEINANLPPIVRGEHPKVGCVILDRKGRRVAEAHTRQSGNLHAEVLAIQQMQGNRERGHTLIATLEPCSSRAFRVHGNEISCAKFIIRSGIKQVIVGTLDPGPGIKGRGLFILTSWGIYFTSFPYDLLTRIQLSNWAYLRTKSSITTIPPTSPDGLVPAEHEFDLSYAQEPVRAMIQSQGFRSRMALYHTEWTQGPLEQSFYEYLVTHRRAKMVDLIGHSNITLIADYLAVPPEENDTTYAIKALASWYLNSVLPPGP